MLVVSIRALQAEVGVPGHRLAVRAKPELFVNALEGSRKGLQ